jgi:hypothetical protein
MRNNLVPTVITDKNGKVTTVLRRQATFKPEAKPIPAAKLHDVIEDRSFDAQRSKYQNILANVQPAILERQRQKELLEAGAEEKAAIITRLKRSVEDTGRDDLTSRINTHHLESFEIMERLFLRKQVNQGFAKLTMERYHSLTGDTFREWLKLAERHYDELSVDDREQFLLAGFFSTTLMMNDGEKREKRPPLTDQQERNYLRLNIAAFGSTLEGKTIREGSGWGIWMALDNDDMKKFALECEDPEYLERVCAAIKNGNAKRFSEVLVLADGDTIAPLSDGAL